MATPPLDREAIFVALFALLDGAGGWATSDRVFVPFINVTSFPALFVEHIEDEYLTASSLNQHRPTGLPPMIYLDAAVWVYGEAATGSLAETEIHRLVDLIEGTLQPRPARSALTLGGLVRHCWLDKHVTYTPGNLLGTGKIALLTIRMLVPGVSPTGVAIP